MIKSVIKDGYFRKFLIFVEILEIWNGKGGGRGIRMLNFHVDFTSLITFQLLLQFFSVKNEQSIFSKLNSRIIDYSREMKYVTGGLF